MDNKNIITPIATVIKQTGIKPAQSFAHELCRVLLIIGLIAIIYKMIKNECDEEISIDDISDTIKPGSLMYQSIMEMDEDTRNKYIKNIYHVLKDEDPRKLKKYINGIQVSLIAGIASEYMVNGNLTKPMGIVAKTILYSIIYTTVS